MWYSSNLDLGTEWEVSDQHQALTTLP